MLYLLDCSYKLNRHRHRSGHLGRKGRILLKIILAIGLRHIHIAGCRNRTETNGDVLVFCQFLLVCIYGRGGTACHVYLLIVDDIELRSYIVYIGTGTTGYAGLQGSVAVTGLDDCK